MVLSWLLIPNQLCVGTSPWCCWFNDAADTMNFAVLKPYAVSHQQRRDIATLRQVLMSRGTLLARSAAGLTVRLLAVPPCREN